MLDSGSMNIRKNRRCKYSERRVDSADHDNNRSPGLTFPSIKEYKAKAGKQTGYMSKKKGLTCSIVVILRSNNYHVTKSVTYWLPRSTKRYHDNDNGDLKI